MAKLRLARGTTAQVTANIGLSGSVAVDMQRKALHIYDGVNAGGFSLPTSEELQEAMTELDAAVTAIESTVADTDPRLTDSREWTAETVSQAEAEAGVETTRRAWTAQRIFQAITAWWNASGAKTKLDGIEAGATVNSSDATLLDRTNHTGTQAISTVTGLQTALDGKQNSLGFTPENSANKGVANGYAELDSSGKVPAAQLPSFVDDVLEFANLAGFPGTGETGKIYVALDTNAIYRWSGSAYIEISPTAGNADTATKLATARSITLTGDVSGTASFDGSANISITATVADDSHAHVIGNVDGLQTALDAKEPTIATGTTAQFLRGDKAWVDFATTVRAAVLTGLSTATATAVAAADSVLVAIGKLQAQINNLSSGKLDASANAVSASKLATARNIALTGDATGNVNFDGSGNVSIATTLATVPVAKGGTGSTSASGARSNLGIGSMATRSVTISTGNPSGGADGDIWIKYL